MNKFGLDLSELSENMIEVDGRETIPGMVAHVDGDFLAYQVSAIDTIPIDVMQRNHDSALKKIKKKTGAERIVLHLTPKDSNKGLRHELAVLKEYQGNRLGKIKPKLLTEIRQWMHDERKAVLHTKCEADDGMAMAAYADPENTCIVSKDKDLLMVPGIQMDWDSGELSKTTDPFGWIEIKVKGNGTKKLRGRGWKFFWAQMLMGDTADNISGLPALMLPDGRFKQCGLVTAFHLLDPIKTNNEAFQVVRDAYEQYHTRQGFKHYKTKEPVPFGTAFISEAQLLWMRRSHDENDVITWLRETCL